MGKEPDKPWKIYLISADGGSPQQLLPEERNQADPSWSPDGQSLLFGRPPDYWSEARGPKAIYLLDLRTNQVSKLPGSDGLFAPRWSPDGRYVAAMPMDQMKLMLFDFTTGKWVELVKEQGINNPVWTRDGKHLYFQGIFLWGDADIYRVRLSDRKLERIASFKDIRRPNPISFSFLELTPEGSPLGLYILGIFDIYALDWQAP